MNQLGILQTFETLAVIILSSRIKAIIILADITGNDVAIHCQACGVISDTDSGMSRLQTRFAIVQHKETAIACYIRKFFQQCTHLCQALGTEVSSPVVPTDICHRFQSITCSGVPLERQPQHLLTFCRLDIHIVVNRVHTLTYVGALCDVDPAVGIVPGILHELLWRINYRVCAVLNEANTQQAHVCALLCV